ncbi:hypothetical protein Tco_0893284 [Tanacetum coccineum]|uniref:Uncharacterized protein n=1 Tax=Tanacetum coccineum TaxID=301880 RepID=A0ABQ5C9Z1_9ASTR
MTMFILAAREQEERSDPSNLATAQMIPQNQYQLPDDNFRPLTVLCSSDRLILHPTLILKIHLERDDGDDCLDRVQ